MKEYLYYNVFRALRSGIEKEIGVSRYTLTDCEFEQFSNLVRCMPKIVTYSTDGCAVWNVNFDDEARNPKFLSNFASYVYDLVANDTVLNPYVEQYAIELYGLLYKLLEDNSDDARYYFGIMKNHYWQEDEGFTGEEVKAINFYTKGYITSVTELLEDFFRYASVDEIKGSPLNHTTAALYIMRKAKPFLRMYNKIHYSAALPSVVPNFEGWEHLDGLLHEATALADDCVIHLFGSLKDIENNDSIITYTNNKDRYSIIIRNAGTDNVYLLSVGWTSEI
jgi:hypothetical protein